MENVFLKPARDDDGSPMVVPDEMTHAPLAADGEWKPLTSYWARRIRDQDVTRADPEVPRKRPVSGPLKREPDPPLAAPASKE